MPVGLLSWAMRADLPLLTSHARLLLLVDAEPKLTQEEIGKRLDLTMRTVNRLIGDIRDHGYIRDIRDIRDHGYIATTPTQTALTIVLITDRPIGETSTVGDWIAANQGGR